MPHSGLNANSSVATVSTSPAHRDSGGKSKKPHFLFNPKNKSASVPSRNIRLDCGQQIFTTTHHMQTETSRTERHESRQITVTTDENGQQVVNVDGEVADLDLPSILKQYGLSNGGTEQPLIITTTSRNGDHDQQPAAGFADSLPHSKSNPVLCAAITSEFATYPSAEKSVYKPLTSRTSTGMINFARSNVQSGLFPSSSTSFADETAKFDSGGSNGNVATIRTTQTIQQVHQSRTCATIENGRVTSAVQSHNSGARASLSVVGDGNVDMQEKLIQQTLAKTLDTFQHLLERHRAEWMQMFPQFSTLTFFDTSSGSTDSNLCRHAFLQYNGPNSECTITVEQLQQPKFSITELRDSESDDDDYSAAASVSNFGEDLQPFSKRLALPAPISPAHSKQSKTDKAYFAAKELVDSEKRYVLKLHLIDRVFRESVVKENALSADVQKTIFSNSATLYKFHNDFLLPELEQRLNNWSKTGKISDVLKKLAPYLRLYSEYINGYDNAISAYKKQLKKQGSFGAIVAKIQKMPDCDNLPLESHLICPVQRITRYQLLLSEYLKNLSDGHQDVEDTKSALELVKSAAQHANEIMRRLDKYRKVIEIQEQLIGCPVELVTPGRELCRQGVVVKISARSQEPQQRRLIMFNDLLLLCSDSRIGNRLSMRVALPLSNISLQDGDNLEFANTFYIVAHDRTFELSTGSLNEKLTWQKEIWVAMKDCVDNLKTIAKDSMKALKGNTAATCSQCSRAFGFLRKGKLCTKCNKPMCKKCMEGEVCAGCGRCDRSKSIENGDNQLALTRNQVVHSGWLQIRNVRSRRQPARRWCTLTGDLVFHVYNDDQKSSDAPLARSPMPGCQIALHEPTTQCHFKLTQPARRRTYILQADNEDQMARWMTVLDLASRAQLPEESQSQSSLSSR